MVPSHCSNCLASAWAKTACNLRLRGQPHLLEQSGDARLALAVARAHAEALHALGEDVGDVALRWRVGGTDRRVLLGGIGLYGTLSLVAALSVSLPMLFVARLLAGAGDAIAWGVGFALVADLFGPHERGRVIGLVMSGSNLGFMLGPSIGGWLYESGGPALPFLLVTVLGLITAGGFLALHLSPPGDVREEVPFRALIRFPDVAACTIVVIVISSTLAMMEPVLSLHLSSDVGLNPGRVGMVFGVAAIASAVLHPVYGRLADRFGSRRLMLTGMAVASAVMPFLAQTETYRGALTLFLMQAGTMSMVVTPSLTYMAEAGARAGAASFGVSYGLYNFAWGCGLLTGPALGGVLYDQFGFSRMLVFWPLFVLATAAWFAVAGRRQVTDPVAIMNPLEDNS